MQMWRGDWPWVCCGAASQSLRWVQDGSGFQLECRLRRRIAVRTLRSGTWCLLSQGDIEGCDDRGQAAMAARSRLDPWSWLRELVRVSGTIAQNMPAGNQARRTVRARAKALTRDDRPLMGCDWGVYGQPNEQGSASESMHFRSLMSPPNHCTRAGQA